MKKEYRIIISGGGTGGHIFPALSIADAIRAKHPEAKILFVGADNRMEMQRVPDAGYDIVGLPIAGFDRKNLLKNFKVLWKIFKSQRKARKVIKEFAPQAAVGVGGYASGPTLKMAASMDIPTLIQEQNSYAGVTNKILSKRAKMICVAYDGMERFFPKEKIKLTGNPVRKNLLEMRATANKIPVAEEVMRYAMMLCSATHPDSEFASEAAKKYVRLGASPRAGQALISAAKVKALMNGRFNVSYNDINELAYPVLRHRMKLTFEAIAERISADEIVKMIIDELMVKNKLVDEAPKAEETAENEKKTKKFGRK